jgi:hypothetical protein
MNKKQSIITFKVDDELYRAIKNIPNRSEFIRSAILEALGSVCPLCKGTGMLTKNQKRHWDDFSVDHSVKLCNECKENILVCECLH